MKYNFDRIVERRGTGSLKWDTVQSGAIPLWVADMDFPCLPELQEALIKRASHPFYGYRAQAETFSEAVCAWYSARYGFKPEQKHILSGPGTVLSLGMIVRELSAPGEGVLILTPVYTPFFEVIRTNGRRVVEVPLSVNEEGRFILDIDVIEAVLEAEERAGKRTPLAFFCSPHNPGGRVWSRDEIKGFLELAKRRNMIVASDEIHGDFVYHDCTDAALPAGTRPRFVSAADMTDYTDRVVVVSGANKTFNLGGIHISHLVAGDDKLRKIMQNALYREAHHEGDIFAELAVETVYRCGGPWLDELRPYLWENIKAAAAFFAAELPEIRAAIPDGTYLVWADARKLIHTKGCKTDVELARLLETEAKVKITAGSIYGRPGAGYVRINAASPRQLLMEGLGRIQQWACS